jgi:hypothetical protein
MGKTAAGPLFTTVAGAAAWLAEAAAIDDEAGLTDADPIPLRMSLELSAANWTDLLTAIAASNGGSGVYVALDLAACTRGPGSTPGSLYSDGTFDPDGADTDPGRGAAKGKIVSLVFPAAATSIKASSYILPTFRYFTALTDVSGANILTVGAYAFYNCFSLSSVTLPKASSIGNLAFYSTALTMVSFPEAITIGEGVFAVCTSLSSVSFPVTLTTIGESIFAGCTGLTSITVDPANPAYKHSDDHRMLLTTDGTILIAYPTASGTVILPGITIIGARAFQDCTSLSSVSLPSATIIGKEAFKACTALTTVSLPSATTIGEAAFLATGTGGLTLTLPQAAPTVEVSSAYTTAPYTKSVIIKTPALRTGYDGTWPDNFKTVFGQNATIDLSFEELP